MNDLFSETSELLQIPMQNAEVFFQDHFHLHQPEETILSHLIEATPWQQHDVIVWGKKFPQPRLIAWYGDVNRSYSYSGIKLSPLPWTPALLEIRKLVEDTAGTNFNSVLLNYYRDNQDSMGFHSDDEPELGEKPIIASLSLGATRTFVFKPKRDQGKSVRIQLRSGSLLLMKGDTQKNWKHGIEKEARACGPRVNLTFRRILR